MITIYTDGACVPNPGPGSWAALVNRPGQTEIVVVVPRRVGTFRQIGDCLPAATVERLRQGRLF